ncbi:MAG: DUF6514 family protein [Oscillospiraceae bacterium]|nr:DUF6514 family protein [Oscillospiraceae bacterium]
MRDEHPIERAHVLSQDSLSERAYVLEYYLCTGTSPSGETRYGVVITQTGDTSGEACAELLWESRETACAHIRILARNAVFPSSLTYLIEDFSLARQHGNRESGAELTVLRSS